MDIESTIQFITEAHRGQYDKLGIPYVEHPKSVATILSVSPSYHALSPEYRKVAIFAALLHDIIEDTEYSVEDLLNKGYDSEVVYNVDLLTYRVEQGDRLSYYERLMVSPVARAVKVADIIHNSLSSRLKHLNSSTQTRLKIKYDKAKEVLFTEADTAFVDSRLL